MPDPRYPADPLSRDRAATWSTPSTRAIVRSFALVIVFGAAFMFDDRSGSEKAVNPTMTSPPAGAQFEAPQASPPATTGSGNAK